MGISTAIKAFFAALTSRERADAIERALSSTRGVDEPKQEKNEEKPNVSVLEKRRPAPGRSEALELLAALQREARFIDFIKEDVDECDDETLGAAARIVRNRCADAIERFFAIRPATDKCEGEFDTLDEATARNGARARLLGAGRIDGETTGRVAHAGWRATKVEMPIWTGTAEDAFMLAPEEIEIER